MLPLRVRLQLIRIVIILTILSSVIPIIWAGPSEEEVCNVKADYALGLEDYSMAIMLHLKHLRTHRDDALAHYHLGFAYGMMRRTTEEINEYLKAAKLGLHKWDLFLNLGLAYLEQNESEQATSALETAVRLAPDRAEVHFNLAIAFERDQRLREALEEINTSLRIAPENLDERNAKAIIYAEMGNVKAATKEWAYLLRVAPDYAPARNNLSILTTKLPVRTLTTPPNESASER